MGPLDEYELPLPLLITGVSGVVGWNALPFFQRLFPGQVIGTRPRQTERLNGPGIIPLEAQDAVGMRELFRIHRFRSVLNCTGNCALKACELDPAMARILNVAGAAATVACARRQGARLVHLSTDLVFSGAGTGNYVETDALDPVSIYGKTMAEGEEVVRAADPGAAVLRISLPMGPSFNRHAGAIDWIQSRFRHGRFATLYFDEVRSCTYVDDLNRVFLRFLAGTENGVFHLGGPKALSLYQIAQIVNRVGGHDPHLLKGCPRRDAGPIPPRAGNVSMNSDKLITMFGEQPFRPWPLGDDLMPDDRDWHRQRPVDEAGSFQRITERLYRYPRGD